MITFILILLILIGVHELGHLIVGKLLKVHADEFSIGFGPAILKKKWRGTTWKLAALPLGGYVRFRGDKDLESNDPTSFWGCPPWKRAVIAFAGPAVNLIFPFFLYFFYAWGHEVPRGPNDIPPQPGAIIATIDASRAVDISWRITTDMYGQMYDGLKLMVTKPPTKDTMGGPVMIYEMSKAAEETTVKQRDLGHIIDLLAMLSINLGFLNLLPIPVLDGGHIVTSGVEIAIRRKIGIKARMRLALIGVVFLLSIMAFAIYSDAVRYFM